MATYSFGGNTGETPESLKAKRELLKALMAKQNAQQDFVPRNVGEGLVALGEGFVTRKRNKTVEELTNEIATAEAEGRQASTDAWSDLWDAIIGGGGSAAPVEDPNFPVYKGPQAAPPPDLEFSSAMPENMKPYAAATGELEAPSYTTIHPPTKKGNRAYGRYGVMDFNIPDWTEKYYGQRLTPQQFLNNPKAQDIVYAGQMKSYLDANNGDPREAASLWFTGQPYEVGQNRRDILGTSGADYVSRYVGALQGQYRKDPNQPVRVADNLANPDVLKGLAAATSDPYLGAGEKAMAQSLLGQALTKMFEEPKPRKMYKDANGRQRYEDTNELVNPNLEKEYAPPTSAAEYEYYRRNLPNGQPPMSYEDWVVTEEKAAIPPSVNPETEGVERAKITTARAGELSGQASAARSRLNRIRRLEQLLAQSPQGGMGALVGALSAMGVKLEGAPTVEAITAILNQMIPEQRTAGVGTMSDRDILMYKASLPQLINTPEGNRLILETMRGLAEYDAALGYIAEQYLIGEITAKEFYENSRKVANPFDGYLEKVAKITGTEVRTLPQIGEVVDGFRYKGGDPNDPNSWEPK